MVGAEIERDHIAIFVLLGFIGQIINHQMACVTLHVYLDLFLESSCSLFLEPYLEPLLHKRLSWYLHTTGIAFDNPRSLSYHDETLDGVGFCIIF